VEVVAVILLDTHALIWLVTEPKRLSRPALRAAERAALSDGWAISAITLWELAFLLARGRIHVYGTLDSSVRTLIEGVAVKAITPEIAVLATQFPDDFPSDPADRIISATARAEGLSLITRDEKIRESPLVSTVW
jgi:PIN domain nuclease of toxin-antitoxin system